MPTYSNVLRASALPTAASRRRVARPPVKFDGHAGTYAVHSRPHHGEVAALVGEEAHGFPVIMSLAPSFQSGAHRFRLVYSRNMNRAGAVRQSVSLPSVVAKRVRAIAKTRKLSANRVLVDLIETGLQARESERERFLTLARRFKESSDPDESDRLREELAHVIFGE